MTKEGIIVSDKLTMHPSRQYPSLHTSIPVETFHRGKRRVLDVPVYGTAILDERLCSKYVRMAASDLFGKEYTLSNAWDRRYKDNLICEVGDLTLEFLAKRGILKPGMIVGAHNPESTYNQDLDSEGKPVKYTHNVLFLGMNAYNNPLIAEQFVTEINVRTEGNMRNSQLTPIEIINAKPKIKRSQS